MNTYAITNRLGPFPNRKRETLMGDDQVSEFEQISEPDQAQIAAEESRDLDVSDVEVGAVNPEDDDEDEDEAQEEDA